ncbi:MAG: hypothetical protein HQL74_07250 [Magnetococcales bacterium]|nr:hypothetical protein [Magnetococcales bacterium]
MKIQINTEKKFIKYVWREPRMYFAPARHSGELHSPEVVGECPNPNGIHFPLPVTTEGILENWREISSFKNLALGCSLLRSLRAYDTARQEKKRVEEEERHASYQRAMARWGDTIDEDPTGMWL